MNKHYYLEKLKTFISLCTEEELVWVLHVFNRNLLDYQSTRLTERDRSYEGLKADIDCLNSLNQLKDINKLIIKKFENYDDHEVKYFLYDLEDFKINLKASNIDLTKTKNNARFLNFACNLMIEETNERELNKIKSNYFKLLYIAFTYPFFYKNPREIERIFLSYSDIHSKYPFHFKNDKDAYFYIWAKKYMDEIPSYRSRDYCPIDDFEYPIVVDSIFDMLYYQNPEVHYALRKKLSNAWYQKKYRQENKGKKENYYALTKKAKESLKVLYYKRNLTEDQMIESLINEHYTKECCSTAGTDLYK